MTFEASTSVYFKNTGTTITEDYAHESDALTVKNYSTDPVDLTVTVKATDVEGITLTDDETFANDKNTSLYLALQGVKADGTDDSANIGKVGSTGVAQITKQLAKIGTGSAAGKEPYVIKWNPIRDQYEYVWNATTDATVDQYSFKLTGKCNPVDATGTATTGSLRSEWLEVLESGETPELELIWTVQNPFEVTIKMEADADPATKAVLTIDGLTAEQNYKSATMDNGTATAPILGEGVSYVDADWTAENGGKLIINLGSNWLDWMDGNTVTIAVTLTDGTVKTVTTKAP